MDRGILLLGRTGSTNRPRPLPVCLSTPPSRSALRGADSQTASASASGRSLHSVNKRVWQLCGRAREGGGVVAGLLGSAVVQMVGRPCGVAAFGAASVKAVPDLIRVRFKIVRVEQAPATAFEAARDAVRAVRGVLRQHGIGDGAVEGSRLDLKTATEYVDGSRKFVGYQCQAAFAVESGALDDLEPLLVDVVAAGANEIDGVDFDVIAKRELRAEARRKAVAAARAKADLYAEAAGVRVGAILHVEDVDPEQPGTSRYRSHAEAAATTAQDLAPGHIVVSAAVIIGYALARPLSSCIATSKKTPAMTITCTIQAGPSRYCWRPSRGTTWVLACAGTNCWRCRGLEPSRGQRSPRRGRCCCSYRSWPTPTLRVPIMSSAPGHGQSGHHEETLSWSTCRGHRIADGCRG